MWKRDEAAKPTSGQTTPAGPAVQQGTTAAAPQPKPRLQSGMDLVNIGKSVVIKGELNGSEDLTIEGHIEGKIELKDHVLTIGPNGKIKAQVFAGGHRRRRALPRQRRHAAQGRCACAEAGRDARPFTRDGRSRRETVTRVQHHRRRTLDGFVASSLPLAPIRPYLQD